jgi:hypothetical protein
MSRISMLNTKYSELFENSLSRLARATVTSRAGSYGYDDCFRDWAQAVAESVMATKGYCDIVLGDIENEFQIPCPKAKLSVYRSFDLNLPPQIPSQSFPGQQLSTGTGKDKDIPFDAFMTDDCKSLIVDIKDLSAKQPGYTYKAELTWNNFLLARLVLIVEK